jgi:hypothetical protein
MILKLDQVEGHDKPRDISPTQLVQRHMKHIKYPFSLLSINYGDFRYLTLYR